jgi:hydroxypyruvate isomerase
MQTQCDTRFTKGAAILEPHGLGMVLEALSDNPDLFLRGTHQSFMICKAVNSPACKFLFDMYHMQRNDEGKSLPILIKYGMKRLFSNW